MMVVTLSPYYCSNTHRNGAPAVVGWLVPGPRWIIYTENSFKYENAVNGCGQAIGCTHSRIIVIVEVGWFLLGADKRWAPVLDAEFGILGGGFWSGFFGERR